MADELKKREELKRSVVNALIYPVFIMIATLAITIVLTVYVFPKILPILQGFGGQLPWTTRTLIVVSSFMKHLVAVSADWFGGRRRRLPAFIKNQISQIIR